MGIEPELAAPKSDALAACTATHSSEESETFLIYKLQTSSVSLYKVSRILTATVYSSIQQHPVALAVVVMNPFRIEYFMETTS